MTEASTVFGPRRPSSKGRIMSSSAGTTGHSSRKVMGAPGITREPAIVYFHVDYWFNVICMFREDGVYYYCNLSSPFIYDEEALKYIDYDLDIKVYPDGKYHLLDEDEYKLHKSRMKYPEDIDKILRHNVDVLQQWIERKKGPFAPDFIKVWQGRFNNDYKSY